MTGSIDIERLDTAFGALDTPDVSSCIGSVYRYTENVYASNGKFVFNKQISLLKKRSCPGCDECGAVEDDLNQGVVDGGKEFFEFSPTLKHNDIVRLVFVPGPTDWETGYLDSWYYKVVKFIQPPSINLT